MSSRRSKRQAEDSETQVANKKIAQNAKLDDESAIQSICSSRAGTECLNADMFLFFVISKGRPGNVPAMHALFKEGAPQPIWLVGKGEALDYTQAGAKHVIESGPLCPSRNMALDLAAAAGKICVQLSDDLQVFQYLEHKLDLNWKKAPTTTISNSRAAQAKKHELTPVGAARILEAFMRKENAKLGGCYPCMNSGFAFNQAPTTTTHFIVGDFIVVDTHDEKSLPKEPKMRMKFDDNGLVVEKKPLPVYFLKTFGNSEQRSASVVGLQQAQKDGGDGLRFDERFLLKEDYDFTAQHLERYGCVLRNNRLFVKALHRDNPGGAVADRSSRKEKDMIKLLRQKWPKVFGNHRRKDEVMFYWKYRVPFEGVKVAKVFDGDTYEGEVVGFKEACNEDEVNYHTIEYTDGDVEDLEEKDFLEAVNLYKTLTTENENYKFYTGCADSDQKEDAKKNPSEGDPQIGVKSETSLDTQQKEEAPLVD